MFALRLPSRVWLTGVLCGLLFCADASALPQQARRADSTQQQIHARQLFVRGMTEAFLDEHDAAISHFEQALALLPGQDAVLSALSDSHAARNDLASAIYYARQAYVRAPHTPHYGLRLAALQRRSGSLSEAIATYREVTDRHPNLLEAREALAETLTEMGALDRAADVYEQLVAASKDERPDVRLDMLRLYRSLNDADGIERTLRALIDLRPTDPTYRRMLGEFYNRRGETTKAIALFERLSEATPSNTDLMLQLATLYRENGETERAQALLDRLIGQPGASPAELVAQGRELIHKPSSDADASDADASDADASDALRTAQRLAERARAEDPDNSEALVLLAEVHLRQNEPATAAPLLEQAVQINPRSIDNWTLAVEAYVHAEQPNRAIDLAEEALMLFPGQPTLLRASGRAHLAAHNNQTALTQYRSALRALDERAPTHEQAAIHTAIGRLLDRLSRPEEAQAAFQAALDVSDRDPTALAYYALHLADQRTRLDDALQYARRSAAADSSAAALHALGWVHFQRGQREDARALLQEAIRHPLPSARMYEHLGDVHRALGDVRAARRAWERALEHTPNDDALREKLNATQNVQK